jgi:hypothetical protein
MSALGHSQQKQRAPKIHRCPLCSESDGQPSKRDLSQRASFGLMHRSKKDRYSITSSARNSIAAASPPFPSSPHAAT